ncbi:hypothetical protein CYMTET_7250 [Cymbomonas tetramitiformis]|uniref:Uncharacterized protein n=1 Tax=Cymbomonas tetramitiformis TaxID=36881 RepID=A0AAE0GVC6_9CHLO|nr:hypothetical protein CYMTET_7250 [Cymbomonas tetramitiformis]
MTNRKSQALRHNILKVLGVHGTFEELRHDVEEAKFRLQVAEENDTQVWGTPQEEEEEDSVLSSAAQKAVQDLGRAQGKFEDLQEKIGIALGNAMQDVELEAALQRHLPLKKSIEVGAFERLRELQSLNQACKTRDTHMISQAQYTALSNDMKAALDSGWGRYDHYTGKQVTHPMIAPHTLNRSIQAFTCNIETLKPEHHVNEGWHFGTKELIGVMIRCEELFDREHDTAQIIVSVDGAKVSDQRPGNFLRLRLRNWLVGADRRLGKFQSQTQVYPLSAYYAGDEKYETFNANYEWLRDDMTKFNAGLEKRRDIRTLKETRNALAERIAQSTCGNAPPTVDLSQVMRQNNAALLNFFNQDLRINGGYSVIKIKDKEGKRYPAKIPMNGPECQRFEEGWAEAVGKIAMLPRTQVNALLDIGKKSSS